MSMQREVICGFLKFAIFSRGFLSLTDDFISKEYDFPDIGILKKMFWSLIFTISLW